MSGLGTCDQDRCNFIDLPVEMRLLQGFQTETVEKLFRFSAYGGPL